jgi:hypothetical protein
MKDEWWEICDPNLLCVDDKTNDQDLLYVDDKTNDQDLLCDERCKM